MSNDASNSESPLQVERAGHLLVLTLNRPEKLNALNRPMQRALGDAFAGASSDPGIRAIIVTGTGRAFCSGADVGHIKEQTGLTIDQQLIPPPAFTARQCKVFKPTICAVNGVCAGAGLHFVADSDIVIASEAASFVDTHVEVGQVSALEPMGLMRRMPLSAVLRLVILGNAGRISALDARANHLISEVVPAETLMDRARELATIASAVSPAALQESLKIIWGSLDLPLSAAYEQGFERLIRHRGHPDAHEGPQAFLEKRAPRWV